MLNVKFTKENYPWITVLSFSGTCLLGNLMATGDILSSVFALLGSMILILFGSLMAEFILYPVILFQFKNPLCPPSLYLGYCRWYANICSGFSVIVLGFLFEASLTLEAGNEISETAYQVFSMPGFFLGTGIGAERVRTIFSSKLSEL
jgi:hypothetical protein